MDLKSIQAAMSVIAEIGRGETTFDVAGTSVTLRLLVPDEEVSIQREAARVRDGLPENDQFGLLQYMDAFKLGILSRAIVVVGSLDLRAVEHVEIGEFLDNGKPIKEPRAKIMRDLISGWGRPPRDLLFRKYVDLLVQVETKAEQAIVFDPSDLDTEISRLEGRLAELKADKAKREETASERSGFLSQAQAIADLDKEKAGGQTRIIPGYAAPRSEDVEDVDPSVFGSAVAARIATPEPAPARTPVIPARAVPPSVPTQRAAPVAPAPVKPAVRPDPPPVQPDPLADIQDSFADDPDSIEAANKAEVVRRRTLGMPMTSLDAEARRTPPHAVARQEDASEAAEPVAPATPAVLDAPTGSRNPRFIQRG